MSVIIQLLLQALKIGLQGGSRFAGAAGRGSLAVARFGRIQFTGLVARRPLTQLTQQEVRNAMAKQGLREARNAHFVSRLISRGPQFGIHTLDDLARALTNGTARPGAQAGTMEIVFPSGRAGAVLNSAGEFVTFLPL